MKTRKQVLSEFQRMHKQMCGTVNGFINMQEYNASGMWAVKLQVTEFVGGEIVAKDEVSWDNYRNSHNEEQERENEAVLAEFKEKFNLK